MKWYQNPSILHPLAGAPPTLCFRNMMANGPYSGRSLLPRITAGLSATLSVPFYLKERWFHDKKIRDHELSAPPVFIIGHWRSGTTHLHNILSQDPQFATMSFFQTSLPWTHLGRLHLARPAVRAVMPKTRGMDKVKIGPDTPQEEEMALGSMNDLSAFNCFYFPQHLMKHFRQSVLLEDITKEQREQFSDSYSYIVKKISYGDNAGRRTLFKNPASTARIPFLREIFPDAKFVHIVRDPFAVYGSMQKLWAHMTEIFGWESTKGIDFEQATREIYRETNKRYLEDRSTLPPGDLCEVRYEDLTESPLQVVDEIYDSLGIEGVAPARQSINTYLDGIGEYRTSSYEFDRETRQKIVTDWKFAFDEWGYNAE